MTVVNKIKTLLKSLEAAVPPPANCHHVIGFVRRVALATETQMTGVVLSGEEQLTLHVNVDGKFYQFFLNDVDFDLPIRTVDYVVKTLVYLKPAENLQTGAEPGRCV